MKIGNISTSKRELIDITKAWLIISLAFTFVFSGASLLSGNFSFAALGSSQFWILFVVALFTAGIGFLLHELAHKVVAQRYGCVAEFRSFDEMLYLALGLAVVIGFLFAAPGAVMISGMITRKENGIISMAGPMTNYVLGALFFGLAFAIPPLAFIFLIGFSVNMWLGLFNMIPFGNFDGVKIFYWDKIVWGAMVAFGIFAVFFLRSLVGI